LEIVLFQTNQPQYKVYKNQSNLSYFWIEKNDLRQILNLFLDRLSLNS
jgi:hypothetical protein